jgi:hypothetical protein
MSRKINPNPPNANAFAHVNVGPSNEEVMADNERIQAERAAKGFPRVEFGRDAEDKRIFDRTEGEGGSSDPLLHPNPIAELIDPIQAANPDKAYKLLGKVACKFHGLRGYAPVLNERGEQVELGGMFLGEIPKSVADQRQRHYQRESLEAVSTAQDSYTEQVNQIRRDAQSAGLKVLEPGDMPAGEFTDQETGETHFLG